MFFRFPFLFKTISDSISPYDLGFDPFLCLSLGIPISVFFFDFPRKTMGTKEAFSEYFLASIFYLDQCEGHTFSKICDLTFFPSAFDHISIFHFWNFFKKKKRYWTIFGDNFFPSNNSSDRCRGHTFWKNQLFTLFCDMPRAV